MESIQNLLRGRSAPQEPPEIKLIKDYAMQQFRLPVEVVVRDNDIAITAGSAAFANTLRLRGPAIKKLCNTDKRLIFRIA